jgi:hypothetical protein
MFGNGKIKKDVARCTKSASFKNYAYLKSITCRRHEGDEKAKQKPQNSSLFGINMPEIRSKTTVLATFCHPVIALSAAVGLL